MFKTIALTLYIALHTLGPFQCGTYIELGDFLWDNYKESLLLRWPDINRKLVWEIWHSPYNTITIITIDTNGIACIRAFGSNIQKFERGIPDEDKEAGSNL